MSQDLQTHVTAIAGAVGSGLGVDPFTMITIIGTLLPMLAKCFGSTPATAHDYLLDRYDANTGLFDQRLIESCRPRARRAARKSGQGRLRVHELDAITVATLKHALDQEPAALATAVADAAAQPSDE